MIIGKPTHARWRDRLRGSLLNEVVRGSGEIDVHVIRGDQGLPERRPAAPAARAPESPWRYGVALGLVAATLGVARR